MAKGGQFERDTCRLLSLWWSKGKRDDVLWRTAGSGARATMRRKRGLTTANSCGDIAALDAEGKPLVDTITFELKRGYSRRSFADLFDAPANAKVREWEGFVLQAIRAAQNAGTPYWMLITRRDKRRALACFEWDLLTELRDQGAMLERPYPFVIAWVEIPVPGDKKIKKRIRLQSLRKKLVICELETLLNQVSPDHIEALIPT